MELDVSPLAGWTHNAIEVGSSVDASLFEAGALGGDNALAPSFRGCCWNALTKCLLVCDPVECCVRVLRATRSSVEEAGGGAPLLQFTVNTAMERIGGKGTGSGKFLHPVAVDVNSRGEIAVADAKLSRVQVFMGSGTLQSYFGRPGGSRGEFHNISDLKYTLLGHLAIADTGNHRIQIMTHTGGLVMIIGKFGWHLGEFSSPCAIGVSRSGDLFVCDQGNKRIQRLTVKGKLVAAWGSARRRRRHRHIEQPAFVTTQPEATPTEPVPAGENEEEDASGVASPPLLRSVFDSPSGIAISVNGEVVVCDSGASGRILCFSDTVGKLASWPVRSVLQTLRFLTYADVLEVRRVCRFLHRQCRLLRNEWQLSPLLPGSATVRKYNRVVTRATGFVAVAEAFDSWGLRVCKPSQRIRRHVMGFESGFCSAISSLYGALFRFQHEDILRALFVFHAHSNSNRDNSNTSDDEIDRAAFVEIVTLVEEVRTGFLRWEQCPAFRGVRPEDIPTVRTAETLSIGASGDGTRASSPPVAAALRVVECAQQQQLNKLLGRLMNL